MAPARRAGRTAGGVYAVVCMAMWPVPVFGLLHAESSAVIAGVGFFVAAVVGVGAFQRGASLREVLAAQLVALAVPWLLLTVSLLWRPDCGYAQGLGLFALLVPPSVVLGVAASYAVTGSRLRAPRTTVVVGGLVVTIAGVAADLLFHPQLFTYSHVFGGVLGPIYDAELAVRPGLFSAKGQTLLLAVALAAAGHRARGRERRWGRVAWGALAGVGAMSLAAVPLGVQQSHGSLQRALSQRVDLGPVVVHVAPGRDTDERVAVVASLAVYHLDRVADALGATPDQPVDVYLYPDPDTKAALIGSRRTSVVPVWLPTPQIHMLIDEVERSLGHEMVHVVAREFGAPVLRASPAVGLVEGLAVALEPPDGLPEPAALVAAGRALAGDAGGLTEDPAAVVERVMSPGGFWTARAGVAYTASGAFARWLLDTYGPSPVRAAYRTGRFEPAFGAPLADLTRRWAATVDARAPDPEAVAVAGWLFRRPSLFEVPCPHHTPASVRWARAGWRALDANDPARAEAAFDAALRADSLLLEALDGRVRALARDGRAPTATDLRRLRQRADSLTDAAALRALADARRLAGRDAAALYRQAADSLRPGDRIGRALLQRRAALDPQTLLALVGSTADVVDARAERGAPVLAALEWASRGRYRRAWALARRWCLGPNEDGLRLVQAELADRAGAHRTAQMLASQAAAALEDAGARALSSRAEEVGRRAAWADRSLPPRPGGDASIFDARPDPLDDLRPACGSGLQPAPASPLRLRTP